MKAQELNKRVDPDALPYKIRYALAISLHDEKLGDIDDYADPNYWIRSELEHKAKADERFAHQYDPVPRNKPLKQLLKEYTTKGSIVKARAELKKRVLYASFAEQKQILCAFFENVTLDRQFALKFLDTNYDEFYAPYVERAWRQFHEWQSAKVIVHHFPVEFIQANQEALASDYIYLQMRLRLSPDAPIDRTRLEDSAYLYLCARQSIPVPNKKAEHMLYQNVLDTIGASYIRTTVLDLRTVSSIVWSLGMLGKTEILLRFADFQKHLDPLVVEKKWEDVRAMFLSLPTSLDFTAFDRAITPRAPFEQYEQPIHADIPFNLDAYIDEHVEAEQNAFDSPF